MNDRGLDQLFKERLEGYQQSPSDATWNKLDAKLKSRKNKAWWQFAKVAAAIALIACSIYIFNFWNKPTLDDTVTDTSTKTTNPATEDVLAENELTTETKVGNDKKNKQPEKTVEKETLPSNEKAVEDQKIKKDQPQEQSQLEMMQAPQTKVLADKNGSPDHVAEPNGAQEAVALIETNNEIQEKEAITEPPKRSKVTITYKKSPAPPEPTLALIDEPIEKTSNVKKLWIKAQSLRSTDLSLAKIRAAKDQMLVFNKNKKNKDKKVKSN